MAKKEKQAQAVPGSPRQPVVRRFDFGPGEAAPGYTGVAPDCQYDAARGYGFEDITRVYGRERTHRPGTAAGGSLGEGGGVAGAAGAAGAAGTSPIQDRLRRSFCIPLGTAFVIDVPDGVYQVAICLGDRLAETHTLIRAGEGKQVLPELRTLPGQWAEERFSLAVRGGRLRIIVSGEAPRLNAIEVTEAPETLRLMLAGDSTVADQPEAGYPYAGWGQMLPALFKHDVCVDNHAVSGRSSKSFIDEGRLDAMLRELKAGDFLFIQFGHNDEKSDTARRTDPSTTYKEYLQRYVDGAKDCGAQPVLVTPVVRRYFDEEGKLTDTHEAYTAAVRELSEACQVPLIDLAELTHALVQQEGVEGSRNLYMWVYPGEYRSFPSGVQDNTHFQASGAAKVAELVAASIRRLELQPLWMYLRVNEAGERSRDDDAKAGI
ncbi:GDSL family lipase [Paenibacillus sp. CAA11]|uniref:rhamnogalacturonan acetylesterase n=1 Tax=Paenibacillus sp. CAA11 TaxID=1532905 RepID=UPI000D3C1DAD|nr:rhamnogalacturonan acetylesterase [Paenibacillus sp. CAA11]AWB46508.1 GDSL family lipase [Paenibacillus sp. CAA11]